MRITSSLASLTGLALALLGAGCAGDAPTPGTPLGDAPLTINVAPLTLEGVAAADYRLTVKNGAQQVVWTKDVSSTQYGDGQGSLAYVGTCDASSPANTVELTILALRDAEGAAITAWSNPTADAPLVKPQTCEPNADNAVTFDVTVARSAVQGFFDVAVTFSDLFCSAKIDCRDAFLDGPAGRGPTAILALACTGDPDGGTPTTLYLNDIVVTCTGEGYGAVVDPSGGPGNVTPASNPGPTLYGAAVYRGDEQLAGKAYWNVALGLSAPALANAGTCTLTTRATAAKGALANGEIAAGTVYPYIDVSAPILASGALCGNTGLDTSAAISTRYTTPAGAALPFAHAYEQGAAGVIGGEGGGGSGSGNAPTDALLASDTPLARAALVAGTLATPGAAPALEAAGAVTYGASTPLTPAAGGITATAGSAPAVDAAAVVDTTAPFTATLSVSATFASGTPRCAFEAPYDGVACVLDGSGQGTATLASTALVPGETLVADVFAQETPADVAQTNALATSVLAYRQVASFNDVPSDEVYASLVAPDGKVYFNARASTTETRELFVYDPSASGSGVTRVADVLPGANDGATPLAVTPGYVYFVASATAGGTNHLYIHDIAAGTTRELLDIDDVAANAVVLPWGDEVIFVRDGSDFVFHYDPVGDTLTPVSLTYVNAIYGSDQRGIALVNGVAYFIASGTDGSWSGNYLWAYDLASGVLTQKLDAHAPMNLVVRGGTLYTSYSTTPTSPDVYSTRFFFRNAGSGWVRLSDGFVAIQCSGNDAGFVEDGTNLYVAGALPGTASSSTPCGTPAIARIDTTQTTGNVTLLGGATGVGINSLKGSLVAGGWLYYVNSSYPQELRAVDTTTLQAASLGASPASQTGPFAVGGRVFDVADSSRPRLRELTPSGGTVAVSDVATTVGAAPNAGAVAYFAALGNLREYDYATLPATSSVAASVQATGSDDPLFLTAFAGDLHLGARYDGDVVHTATYRVASADGVVTPLPTSSGYALGVGQEGVYYRTASGPARWDGVTMTPLGLGAYDLVSVATDGVTTWALTADAGQYYLSAFDELTGALAPMVAFAATEQPSSLLFAGGKVFVVVNDNDLFTASLWVYTPAAPTPTFTQVTTSGGAISWDQVQSPRVGPDGAVYFADYDDHGGASIFATDGATVREVVPSTDFEYLGLQSVAGAGAFTYLGVSNGIYRWDGASATLIAPGASSAALESYGGHLYALVSQIQASADPGAWTRRGLYRLGDQGWELLVEAPAYGGVAAMAVAGDLLYLRLPDAAGNAKLYALCDAATGCDPTTVLSAP